MIQFFVEGDPATKGSWRPMRGGSGRVFMKADNERESGWSELVALHARQAMALARAPLAEKTQPLRVELYFCVARPVKSEFPFPPKGDIDKLERSVLDAMSRVVYADDKQVVQTVSEKHWSDVAGVFVRVVAVLEVPSSSGPPMWSAVSTRPPARAPSPPPRAP